MTAPAAVPPPVESSNADEVIAALGALLVAGTTVAAVKTLLGTLQGVPAATGRLIFGQRKLAKLLGKKVTDPGQKATTAARIRHLGAQEQAKARAAYIVRATLRLAAAHATKDAAIIAAAQAQEDQYLAAHGKAAAERQTAVNDLITAVGKTKPDSDGRILMGWYAEQFPCPVCLAVDGTNFDVFDPPLIGWPGWVHPHCGCHAGAPYSTDLMTNDVIKKRSSEMKTENRTAKVVEVRGPGTDKPDAAPGFTAKLVSYGVPDTYRTSWTQGVFTRALAKREQAGHSVPVVWDHDWADPVGRVVSYRDEADGFYADVELDDFEAVPRARQAYAQVRSGTMGQFSFAFVRGEEEEDREHRGVMRQTSVDDVQEFSLVLNGAVPGTGVKAVRSAQVDARTAADLITRVRTGELDITDALVELRTASGNAAAPQFEFRAVGDATPSAASPADVLAAVDAALAGVAENLDKVDVEAARRHFSQASSRLSELQYLLGMTPTVEGYGESYSWRAIEQGEQRSEELAAVEPEPFPELAAPRGYRPTRLGRVTLR